MSFSPDIFRSKLDALQDTQDSIVSISQWVLFHHRNAAHLCQLWAQYTLDNNAAFSAKKKLSLLYLCNDVVQQARHKRKPEFASGFAELLPKVFHAIYSTVGPDIQPKIERLISVWSQRSIFNRNQIAAMNKAIELSKNGKDLGDPSADTSTKPPADQVDPAVAPLNTLFQTISKASASAAANVSSIRNQASLYLPEDPSTSETLPSPKVYISKLNMLEKLCNITCTTLKEAEEAQTKALSALASLSSSLSEAIATGQSSYAYIEAQLPRLHTVRDELKEMVKDENSATEESSPLEPAQEPSPLESAEEPSPSFESNDPTEPSPQGSAEVPSPSFESNGQHATAESSKQVPGSKPAVASDNVPKYESSSDDSDDEPAPRLPLKRSLPQNDSRPAKKSVAFSDDVQIKEFERDEREAFGESTYAHGETGHGAAHSPKALLPLKQEGDTSPDDEYDPSVMEDGGGDAKSGLMSLLSKLN